MAHVADIKEPKRCRGRNVEKCHVPACTEVPDMQQSFIATDKLIRIKEALISQRPIRNWGTVTKTADSTIEVE